MTTTKKLGVTKLTWLATVLLAEAMVAVPMAWAHHDPPGCFGAGVDVDIFIFRKRCSITLNRACSVDADCPGGETCAFAGLAGTVAPCETVFYDAILSKDFTDATKCAFEGGTFKLTLPDGTTGAINTSVPCLGGTTSPCDPLVTEVRFTKVPYTVNVSPTIVAMAAYDNGLSHDGGGTPNDDGDTPNAASGSQALTRGVISCNDNDVCTNDVCNPAFNGSLACQHSPVVCDDNDPCTSNLCNAVTGCFFPPGALDCNDNDPCTSDACVTGVGCVNTPGALDCNDNDPCTSDACVTGVGCVNTPGALNCNDNDPCTSDACVAGTGCVNTPGALDCNDNDPCTSDACVTGTGCVNTPGALNCNDNDPCTSDACVAGTGCVNTPGALDCNDNDPCTSDACVPGTGCVNTPGALNCNDNDPCTSDACVPGTGCVNTPGALNCNDNDPCTSDACVPGTGCVNTPGALNCNDNDPCTSDACVPGTGCVNTPGALNCNDNDPCTSDACVAGTGCVNTPGALNCNDNNICTNDACVTGTGCVNTDISASCNDNDVCTDDSCDPILGCQNVPNGNPVCLGLNHFQCYEIKPFQFARRAVTVQDRYGSATVSVRSPDHLCAPSDKRGEDPTAPMSPEHLTGFPAIGGVVRVPNQVIENQFGTVTVDLIRRAFLLVPTSKSLVSAPPPLVNPVTDHFQCYVVRRSIGQPRFNPVRGVSAVDQFGSHAVDLLRPRYFCAPANKNNENPGAQNHTQNLLCYKSRHRANFTERQPFLNNQFLQNDVKLVRRVEFCVPSTLVTDDK